MSTSEDLQPPTEHAFDTYTFDSAQKAEVISAYSWTVPNPIARVLLLHGFRSHMRYNFLRNDTPDSLHQYGDPSPSADSSDSSESSSSSFVRELNKRNMSVYGHDHVGHGSSTGDRAYFDSFQTLVDDTVTHLKLILKQQQQPQSPEASACTITTTTPLFICAHSMGGTIALSTALQHPNLIQGLALSSAATEPPANMFGLIGQINYLLSGITSVLIPKIQVVSLPKGLDHRLQALFESDPLNMPHIGVRARVGRELIVAYGDIAARAPELRTPFVTAAGEFDTLVNPQAAQRFADRAGTKPEDKTVFGAKGRWHNLLVEDGYEEIHQLFGNWLRDRAVRLNKQKKGGGDE